jgi:hypothetical protein
MLHERDITVDSGLLQGQIVNNDRLEYEVPPPQDTEQSVHSAGTICVVRPRAAIASTTAVATLRIVVQGAVSGIVLLGGTHGASPTLPVRILRAVGGHIASHATLRTIRAQFVPVQRTVCGCVLIKWQARRRSTRNADWRQDGRAVVCYPRQ